jgi:galactonate dehydratase
MKIIKFEVVHVRPRYSVLVVHTDDESVVGLGEACLEGKARVVEAALREFEELLVGEDPRRIEHLWNLMYRSTFYPSGSILCSAISAIDQALWDILGKHLGVPVHVLLGGAVRDRVRVYQHVNVGDWEAFDHTTKDAHIEELVAKARQAKADGFTMLKTALPGPARPVESRAFVKLQVERFAALRAAVGDDVDIAIDFHGRVSPAVARQLCRALEPLHPMFVEEPVLPELSGRLAEICAATTVPIATGERLYSRWDFDPVLRAGIAVAQPDLSHAGGISECRRIAALAEMHGVALAPHCPLGPLALAACLQLDLAAPNALIQETSLGIQYHSGTELADYLVDPSVFDFRDGHLARLTGPGLGVEIDEAAIVRAAERPHRWRSPLWRHADGSLAEW